MRKTFFYSFMPSKEEEEKAIVHRTPQEVTRSLIEIRDWDVTPRRMDPTNPWHIKKTVTKNETLTGKLVISHEDMFEHVFRYWSVEMANFVVQGNKCFVSVVDYTDENASKKFQGENAFVASGGNECYVLGLMELVRFRQLNPGDEVGLYWDLRSVLPLFGTFGFKVLNRIKN